MNFSRGHSGTKIQCESCLFSYGNTPKFTKMAEIHELFVLALSLVWFAGATPDTRGQKINANFCFYKVFRQPFGSRTSAPKFVDVRTKKRVFLGPRWRQRLFDPWASQILGVRVRDVCRKSGPKSLYVYAVFFFPEHVANRRRGHSERGIST